MKYLTIPSTKFQGSILLAAIMLLLIGCQRVKDNETGSAEGPPAKMGRLQKEPRRFGMVTGIKPEKIAHYKEMHAKTWEGVLKKIEESNIENYSIYLQKIEDKYFLFSYFEYVGNNYEEDMKRIAADTVTQRWWQETDPCQIPLPEAAAQNQIWTKVEEVFHTD